MNHSEPIKPLTREDVASLLGVSDKTIDKLIRAGSLPKPWQLGSCRRLYWHPDDWNAWIDRQRLGEPGLKDAPDTPTEPQRVGVIRPTRPSATKTPALARLESRQSSRLAALNGRR
jgi:excisionase family DNA binding protein